VLQKGTAIKSGLAHAQARSSPQSNSQHEE
jgi:hypothetical protein